ncbi:transglycosylase associated protein [Streptococcus sp. oral taxon 056 str. F0418]|nr:transglycosylase associated protein [Streptococcus sp. oral taxon 056 str. F0418]
MTMIGSMFVGFIIGLISVALTNRGERMGCIGKMILGLVGAWLGQSLFGNWGPLLHDTAVVPSILGAVILLAIFWKRDK